MDNEVNKKVQDFFGQYKTFRYKKGEVLVRAGDQPTHVFYIVEGIVKQYAISQKGEELVVNMFKKNAFFPMSWAINSTPNNYFFETVEHAVVAKVGREDVLYFLKNNSDVLFDLLSRVFKGTDGLLARLTYLMAASAYGRLMFEILVQANRFGKKSGTRVEITISEKELATETGMTRETVSREMKVLKNKGLVQFEKNLLTILDLPAFEQIVVKGA